MGHAAEAHTLRIVAYWAICTDWQISSPPIETDQPHKYRQAQLTLDILALLALPAAVLNVKAPAFSRPMMPGERWARNPAYAAFAAL
ncbi:hypothetical protein IFM58399_08346 [Aspergillus lentulus]|uniref:Uncharacterized protein n=1 Tax=Aspergillus lentulus TaxID=293939 RepID=A0ABQ1AJH8_ASPLE|nr:uncharacterized protein IFM58399_08346 [Aspergillus lentulus]GFF48610.1 hypothetical protein IFM58399_08346 [Aspergillus lentulus]GFF66374.1 hypothetical protein IFM62136_06600 [Aspergillus lentulus]GFF83063.1 hypothetical protein IFM60648_06566 [Aspergillus lentulus]GFF86589.1 hypothetical protein IFM47457_07206 [Aspergillus lentulus]